MSLFSKIKEIAFYFIAALIVSFVFYKVGWLEINFVLFAVSLTIGWYIGQYIMKKYQNRKK